MVNINSIVSSLATETETTSVVIPPKNSQEQKETVTIQEQVKSLVSPEQWEHLVHGSVTIFTNLIAAFLIFVIGKWLANKIAHLVKKAVMKSMQDKGLALFVHSLVKYLLLLIVICASLGKLGLQTSSLVAMLGAAGLAVGLALQGSLSNFAAGTLIMIFRPFRIGDFIEGSGAAGTVIEIGILSTNLNTPDNKRVIIPNSSLISSSIINYTANADRRVDFMFGIGYNSDIDLARNIIFDLFNKDERVIKNVDGQEAVVVVKEMADSSVNLVARAWVKKDDYWGVFFDIQEAVKKNFDKNNISIPFPQRDLHIHYVDTKTETK